MGFDSLFKAATRPWNIIGIVTTGGTTASEWDLVSRF
jgi:type IV secretory pathway VirB3-like protein